jgi:molybdopterin molybdotransferase
MISVQEAQEIVRRNLPERQVKKVDLKEARGKILAEDIYALEPSPRYTNSAMDGFAVRWEDVKSANENEPVNLNIAGESQAGIPYREELQPGQAARISTGAMLCNGADTIIPVEEAQINGATLRVLKAHRRQQNLRFRGEEFEAGELLLPKGALLNPAGIALLASQGIAAAPVYAAPGAAVIITGTELAPYDAPAEPWQVRDSNGIMLQTAIEESGGAVQFRSHVEDDYKDTVHAVRRAMAGSQLILFSGGVSVGPHDLVKKAAQECGFQTLFWRVRQKPGQPLFFARNGDTLFFGLPGNPVSAYICYLFYVHPVVQHLLGKAFSHKKIRGKLAETIQNTIGRAQLFRVSLENSGEENRFPLVHPLEKQGSHMLTSLSAAGGFILLEVGAVLQEGEMIEVFAL